MKKMGIVLICIALNLQAFAGLDQWFNDADAFFKKYVSSGKVDYTSIQTTPAELNSLITTLGVADLSTASSNTKKAFYINAYNLIMIKSVIDNFPISSPLDVTGIFDTNKHSVAGAMLTLSDIENKKLRPIYNDARIHFVLVCGAKGCPKLASFAYKPATIEAQLESQTKLTINDATFIKVKDTEKKALVSEIFYWYETDFTTDGKSILEYINQYRTTKITATYTVDKYTYDWSLNSK